MITKFVTNQTTPCSYMKMVWKITFVTLANTPGWLPGQQLTLPPLQPAAFVWDFIWFYFSIHMRFFVSQKVQPSKVLIELLSFAHISASSLNGCKCNFFLCKFTMFKEIVCCLKRTKDWFCSLLTLTLQLNKICLINKSNLITLQPPQCSSRERQCPSSSTGAFSPHTPVQIVYWKGKF